MTVRPLADSPMLFLETTIQIDRVIGEQLRRETIRANLRGRTLVTSWHVLGEFNKTLVQDAVVLRNLVRLSPSVEEAYRRLDRFIPAERKHRRTVGLLGYLGVTSDRQDLLDRLETFIEIEAHAVFWEMVDRGRSPDAVGCVLKDWKPAPTDAGGYDLSGLKCTKANPPPCRVTAFIEANRRSLETLVDLAKQSKQPRVVRSGDALDKILRGLESPFGERSNCYVISDALIAHEAPPDAEIYSTDADISAISVILGRKVHQEVALASYGPTPA